MSALAQTLAAAGIDASDIVPIDSLTAQKRMVEAGFGLALLPASSIDEELRAGTLCALGVPALRITIAVVLIHRRRGFQSGATRALVSLLTDWERSDASTRRQTPQSRNSVRVPRPRAV